MAIAEWIRLAGYIIYTLFIQEAKSAWSNLNLEMLVFMEGVKPENPEKTPRSKGKANLDNVLTKFIANNRTDA